MPKYFFNKEVCKKCGGTCCKVMPGFCIPRDIKKLFPAETLVESVKLALDSGKFAVDWYEAEPTNRPFVRPSTKDAIGEKYDPTWGGECVFLTPTGCVLSKELRPHTCKKLEPAGYIGDCKSHYSKNAKLMVAKLWERDGINLFKLPGVKDEIPKTDIFGAFTS